MSGRDLTVDVSTETARGQVSPALFVEMMFDSTPLRLWSGFGDLTFDGHVYTGAGTFGAITEIEESASDVRASGVAMTLSGIPSQYISLGLSEKFQGRAVTIWLAFFDSSMAVIQDPIKIFKGRMDYPQLEESGETARITVFAESHLVDLERPRVRRYTDEDQRQLYPGDTGLRFVAGLQNKSIEWSNGKR